MSDEFIPANPQHRLTDRERFAFELERVWRGLGDLLAHGRTAGRVKDGKPLKVPAKLVQRAKLAEKMIRELAVEAAPHLGVCRAPVIEVGEVAVGRKP